MMEDKGLPRRIVLEELNMRLKRDFTYESGKIIGSMCTRAHPFARKMQTQFLDKNLGDAGLFPAVAELEEDTIEMIGGMLSDSHASGHIVTGGTEANILALYAAKKTSKKQKAEVIVPASAHCSFDKAGDLLGMKIVRTPLDDHFRISVEKARKAITSDTIAIVGIAGTTGLGAVDPIEELSELAAEKGLYMHVDAAFGGFVLPFLKNSGYSVPAFDFACSNVCSMTVDPHKMGLAPIPAGGILWRDERFKNEIAWKISYLAGGEANQATLVGTRSGASIIAVWSLLKHFGKEGYRKMVARCMQLTHDLVEAISEIDGLDIVTEPTMNVVGLKSDVFGIEEVAKRLRLRGWAVSLFPKHIRIVVMPHVQRQHVQEFTKELKNISRELKEYKE